MSSADAAADMLSGWALVSKGGQPLLKAGRKEAQRLVKKLETPDLKVIPKVKSGFTKVTSLSRKETSESPSTSGWRKRKAGEWRFAVLDPMNDCIVFYKMEDLDDEANEVKSTLILSDKKLEFIPIDEEAPAKAPEPSKVKRPESKNFDNVAVKRTAPVAPTFHIIISRRGKAKHVLSFRTEPARQKWLAATRKSHAQATGVQAAKALAYEWEKEAVTCDDLKCFLPSRAMQKIVVEDGDSGDSEDDSKAAGRDATAEENTDTGFGSSEEEVDLSISSSTSETGRPHSHQVLDIILEDTKRRRLALRELISAKQPTVVVVLRHFGCVLCRKLVGTIVQAQKSFESLGVQLVAIGNGTPDHAAAFKKEFSFKGHLLVDPQRKLYEALCCKRGIRVSMSRKTLAAAKNAIALGYRQGETTGDVLQLGGVFLMTREKGIVWQHREQFAGDHPQISTVIAKCARAIASLDRFSFLPNRDLFADEARPKVQDEYGLDMAAKSLTIGKKSKFTRMASTSTLPTNGKDQKTFRGAVRYQSLMELASKDSSTQLPKLDGDGDNEDGASLSIVSVGDQSVGKAGWRSSLGVVTPRGASTPAAQTFNIAYRKLIEPVFVNNFDGRGHVNWIVATEPENTDDDQDNRPAVGIVSLMLPNPEVGDCKMIVRVADQVADTRLLVPDSVVEPLACALRAGTSKRALSKAEASISKWLRARLPLLAPYTRWNMVGRPVGFPSPKPEFRELHIEFEEALSKWEIRSMIGDRFKFGLLYAAKPSDPAATTITEPHCYCTSARDLPADSAFWDVAAVLGDRVPLEPSYKLTKEFSGGLDWSGSKLTGTHTYASLLPVGQRTKAVPVVWHTGPLMPDDRDGEAVDPSAPAPEGVDRTEATQQIQRKKHVGNDVVVVIVNETGLPVDVGSFRSQFNHIFLILNRESTEADTAQFGETEFRATLVARPGVPITASQIGEIPRLIRFPRQTDDSAKSASTAVSDFNPLRRRLLCFLANLESAALLRAPGFSGRMTRTRRQGLEALASDVESFSGGSLSKSFQKSPSSDALNGTAVEGDSGTAVVSPKTPSIPRPPPVNFGIEFEVLMSRQHLSAPELAVPRVLKELIETLEQQGLLSTEGVFRISPNMTSVEEAKDSIELGKFDKWAAASAQSADSIERIHVCCSLLKMWFRELPSPLIPASSYEVALMEPFSVDTVLETLSPGRAAVLRTLLGFLSELAKHSDKTKMNPQNLAIVFAPGLLRCPSDDPIELMSAARREASLVEYLIENTSFNHRTSMLKPSKTAGKS